MKVILFEKDGISVATESEEEYLVNNVIKGTLRVPIARLWWPNMMHPDPAYLYQLEVRIFKNGVPPTELNYFEDSNFTDDKMDIFDKKKPLDIYRLNVGIRTLFWNNDTFLINGRPVYLHGFGRHEDSDVRSKFKNLKQKYFVCACSWGDTT